MEKETIIHDIKAFIEANILAGDLNLNARTVLKDAGIDSFSIVEIILFIERQYGVVITDDKLVPENFSTLDTLAVTVMELTSRS
jgi:acyl carrier protein